MPTIFALQRHWWCPMCGGYGMGGWGMMFGWFFWLVVIVVLVWLVSRYSGGRGGSTGPVGRGDSAEAILRERYARGEIDEATYRRMLEELRRGG